MTKSISNSRTHYDHRNQRYHQKSYGSYQYSIYSGNHRGFKSPSDHHYQHYIVERQGSVSKRYCGDGNGYPHTNSHQFTTPSNIVHRAEARSWQNIPSRNPMQKLPRTYGIHDDDALNHIQRRNQKPIYTEQPHSRLHNGDVNNFEHIHVHSRTTGGHHSNSTAKSFGAHHYPAHPTDPKSGMFISSRHHAVTTSNPHMGDYSYHDHQVQIEPRSRSYLQHQPNFRSDFSSSHRHYDTSYAHHHSSSYTRGYDSWTAGNEVQTTAKLSPKVKSRRVPGNCSDESFHDKSKNFHKTQVESFALPPGFLQSTVLEDGKSMNRIVREVSPTSSLDLSSPSSSGAVDDLNPSAQLNKKRSLSPIELLPSQSSASHESGERNGENTKSVNLKVDSSSTNRDTIVPLSGTPPRSSITKDSGNSLFLVSPKSFLMGGSRASKRIKLYAV